MNKTILTLFLLTNLFLQSQENYNAESYKVSLGDITSKTYTVDSTAHALVIFETGNSYVDPNDFDLRTKIKRKIKILTKEGSEHANVVIPLYITKTNEEKVDDILATTYNEIDGKVIKTKLLEKDIFRENYNENRTLVKFTLPNIKPGSVITYSYTISSPYMFKYHGWDFQDEIPKLYSEYRTSIPGNWVYHIKLVGGKKLAINDISIKKHCIDFGRGASADCSISHYAMKNIPAFIEEDYMTAKSNYLARIEYELETFKSPDGRVDHITKTWKDVDIELKSEKDIGKQLRKKIEVEELLPQDLLSETDTLKKAQGIYKYVQSNFTWNREYKIFKDVSIKELLKNKSGNISSINILLHNLLRDSGIQVKPILLSTRKNGLPTVIYPVLSDFNYLITQATINNKTYTLDATDKFLYFGQIPFRCLNRFGRLIDFKNGSDWININPTDRTNTMYKAVFSFNKNDELIGHIESKRTGYHALSHKKRYFSDPEDYINELENTITDIEISDFSVNTNSIASPNFGENYTLTYPSEKASDLIFISPFFIKLFNTNPFKLQERSYPIDFGYKDGYYLNYKLELNDDYIVSELPKDIVFHLPHKTGQLSFSAKHFGNNIILTFMLSFKETVFEPEFYPYLKEIMQKVIDIQNNSTILLKRKS
ncbi:DUF3857 and transglutaminase domain-containing protein [Tamlana fucoidanivorans]|uniref:DUF3857 domain-containing protein n=1 Tax=Allotamlana fucoidanivorans TaxID=2583814 RepID=A0A5C4SHB6_9FLAO|nr:DUF3857 domain-containing protein [Tamlana fucoidanivorans]TNJ43059.1 DUF3857 domain-containing protein [Tamlana fucoidanivorans]